MIKNNKNFYYWNVHFFCEKIHDLIIIKNKKLIKINLNICLRNTIFIWYIAKFNDLKRFNIRNFFFEKKWINKLKKRFKSNYVIVINFLITKRYIIFNVRNERKSFDYVQQIVNYVKNVNFQNIQQQLTWTWKNFNVDLKRDISTFNVIIIFIKFLTSIKNKKKYDKNFMTLRMKENAIIVTSIVVLFVKSINKIFDKTVIVKTIINRSTTFMFFNTIRLSNITHIKIRTLIIIIKNINIATQIDNQTILKIDNRLSRLHYSCLIRVNFYK